MNSRTFPLTVIILVALSALLFTTSETAHLQSTTFCPTPSFPEAIRYRHFQGGVVSMRVGDFNLDGKPDLATDRGVLLGAGDGTFLFGGCISLPDFGDSFVVADINSDSKPDIISVDVRSSVRVHIGKGNGSFEEERIFPAGETPRFCSCRRL